MNFKKLTLVFSSILLVAAANRTLAAPTQTVVAISMTGQQSAGGITPDTAGGNYRYVYNIATGQSISDTIPVKLCTSTTDPENDFTYSLTLAFSGPSGDSIGEAVPSNPILTADGCQTVNITVNSGTFNTIGIYAANSQVSVAQNGFIYTGGSPSPHLPTTEPNNTLGEIQVRVNVTDPSQPPPSCFISDSDFNFLLSCSGEAQRYGNGGRFSIVANKKGIETATNPGQFYYNVLWTNHTGSDQTITVNFARIGVIPQGAQAIHAAIFPSFPVLSEFNFDVVNSAIPSGADDALESVIVPNGSTLWVDYHLEWSSLGGPSTGTPLTCDLAGTNCFKVLATISSGGTTLGTCEAGACGYLKH
jgi:hypothetical protein